MENKALNCGYKIERVKYYFTLGEQDLHLYQLNISLEEHFSG